MYNEVASSSRGKGEQTHVIYIDFCRTFDMGLKKGHKNYQRADQRAGNFEIGFSHLCCEKRLREFRLEKKRL